jgi:adenylate kinase family enzyme
LAEAMLGKLKSSKGFLIDGYPREVAQVINKTVSGKFIT